MKLFVLVIVGIDLLMTINRMSIAGAGICLLSYYVFVRRHESLLGALWLGACLVVALGLAFGSDLLTLLSRSGDVRELTTGTSRTAIWAAVTELSWERPHPRLGAFGCDLDLPLPTGTVRPGGPRPQSVPRHLVQPRFVGLALLMIGIWVSFAHAVRHRRYRALIMMVYFMFLGLTEALPIYNVVLLGFLAFAFTVFEMTGVTAYVLVPDGDRARPVRGGRPAEPRVEGGQPVVLGPRVDRRPSPAA